MIRLGKPSCNSGMLPTKSCCMWNKGAAQENFFQVGSPLPAARAPEFNALCWNPHLLQLSSKSRVMPASPSSLDDENAGPPPTTPSTTTKTLHHEVVTG